MDEWTVIRDVEFLHPVFAPIAMRALVDIQNKGLPVRIFETWRSPIRQQEMVYQGTSKAGPWQSAHAFGLACDLVPYIDGKWTWQPPQELWAEIHATGKAAGGAFPITWDLAHFCHPKAEDWTRKIRAMLR